MNLNDSPQNEAVLAVFESYPPTVRSKLLELRGLIFDTAAETDGVGQLEETLKWGQPSYLTLSGSGTTIRIDQLPDSSDSFALFVHCQTSLMDDFKRQFPDRFSYDKTRAIHFSADDKLPHYELKLLIKSALTYHL